MKAAIRAAVLVLAALATRALATPVTYQFTGDVLHVNPAAAGFPAALAGVQTGDPITGTFTYDTASPVTPTSFGSPYDAGTHYALTNASFSFTIGSVTLDTWTGTLDAFVWNDKLTTTATPTDGLLFASVTTPGSAQFRLGNLILPTSAFSNEALPSADLPGPFLVSISSGNGVWVDSNLISGFATVTPEPGVAGVGLLALASLARRRVK